MTLRGKGLDSFDTELTIKGWAYMTMALTRCQTGLHLPPKDAKLALIALIDLTPFSRMYYLFPGMICFSMQYRSCKLILAIATSKFWLIKALIFGYSSLFGIIFVFRIFIFQARVVLIMLLF